MNSLSVSNTPEYPKNTIDRMHTVTSGQWLSNIANSIWMRLSALENRIKWSMIVPRENDVWMLQERGPNQYVLEIHRGKRHLVSVTLSPDEVYLPEESWPVGFSHIMFLKNEWEDQYQLVSTRDKTLSPFSIPVENIDMFRQELNKISGTLLTKCGSRKAQEELACSIDHAKEKGKGVFSISGNTLWEIFRREKIDTTLMMRMARNKDNTTLNIEESKEMLNFLANSIPIQ